MGSNRIAPTQTNPFAQPLQINNAFANGNRVINPPQGKVKPFNGGTVNVTVTSKTTQAEVIKTALDKFAQQAGIKDPMARGMFVDRWIKNLGGDQAKLFSGGVAVSEPNFKKDKADKTVSVTIDPSNQGIVKDLRDMQVMSGVISIFDAQTAGRNPLAALSGNSYEQYLGFDPSSYQRQSLNTKYDDSKYKEVAQNPDLADIALDLTQMGLDVVGIFEPTPFADLTNTGISAVRGNWGDAALSLIGVIPYAGDLAKFGKIPKWLKSVEKISSAIDKFADIARNGGKGKEAVEAFVNQAKQMLDKVPFDKLPAKVKEAFEGLKKKVDDFFASVKKSDNPADDLADKSTKVDDVPTKPDTPKNSDSQITTTSKQPDIEPPKKPDSKNNSAPQISAQSTEPSLRPDPKRLPEGSPKKTNPNDKDPNNIRAIMRENESANVLAQNGYKIRQLDDKTKGSVKGVKKPDFEIEGKIFDNYAPSEKKTVRGIWSELEGKINTRQADRFVINMNDSKLSIEQLKSQFENFPLKDLKEILIIKDGKVIPFFPFKK